MSANTLKTETVSAAANELYHVAINQGPSYAVAEERWNKKGDYYLDAFVFHLGEVVAGLQARGNPVHRVLELGIARGVLSIGIALLTPDDTRIVGIDIDEQARGLVAKNARFNGVEHKIEVRIGNMFAPVKPGEKFDLVMGEMPILPVAAAQQEEYVSRGFATDIRNICGGVDGRFFVDALISEGAKVLQPGGAVVIIQPSFIGVAKTLEQFSRHGMAGQLVASREHLLETTTFARENRSHIETVNNYSFPRNANGKEVFFLQVMMGIKT